MGSTITRGRMAAALRTNTGRILYVLFEESYESNVFPQHPSLEYFFDSGDEPTIVQSTSASSNSKGLPVPA